MELLTRYNSSAVNEVIFWVELVEFGDGRWRWQQEFFQIVKNLRNVTWTALRKRTKALNKTTNNKVDRYRHSRATVLFIQQTTSSKIWPY